jgi:TonB family protein
VSLGVTLLAIANFKWPMLLLLLAIISQAAATQPTPLPSNAPLGYPEIALAASVEGIVRVEVSVDATGMVTQVRITEVPQQSVGIEDAFTKTIQQWRFQPATQNGVAVPGTYALAVNLSADLPGHIGRIYPASSQQAWDALERAVRGMGFSTETRSAKEGVLITKRKEILGAGHTYYIFVPRSAEPARIYVGSIRVRGALNEYNAREVNEELLASVEKILGSAGVPVPLSPVRRANLAMTLLPPGIASECLSKTAKGVKVEMTRTATPTTQVTPPQSLSRISPRYPSRQYDRGRIGVVAIGGVIGEDGFYWPTRVVQGNLQDQEFIDAAFLATSLWRYRPAVVEGCPVPVTQIVTVSYTIR